MLAGSIAASSDATEGLLAAGTLAALGEPDGVDTMIDALSSEEPLRNVDPPMNAWRSWWSENASSLTWNAETGRYEEAAA